MVKMYRQLDSEKIVQTAESLQKRILARFPASSLGRLVGELVEVARNSARQAARLARPHVVLRGCSLFLTLLMLLLLMGTFSMLDLKAQIRSLSDLAQLVETGINDVIFLAAAIFFLFTLEGRWKRNKALRSIHELRALAHVVDMHQLTKDPDRLLNPGQDTAHSPRLSMTRFELSRYLDYCSEALSILSKLAAIYPQYVQDPVILDAVDAVEDLTNGLSRKIWQKIMILDHIAGASPGS